MLTTESLQYLYELSQNNNRDWFEKNKKRYEANLKKSFEAFVGELILRLKSFEPDFQIQPKDCIHRIYRDTRFSADKTPYKTHVSAVFTPRGRQTMDVPGYYMQLSYGSLMIGGGAYFLDKEPLTKVRTAIMQDTEAFRSLVFTGEFFDKFGELKGDKNKVLPPAFKEAAKKEPLIANKQFYFMAELDPELCLQPDFPEFVAAYFQAAQPINAFFRDAIGKP